MPAKKTKPIHTLEGPRNFTMMVPSYSAQKGASAFPELNGWLSGGADTIYYESYIDLSGFERENMTIMPMEAEVQDPGLYSGGRLTDSMWVMDVVSQTRLDAGTLQQMLDPTNNNYNNAPGMMGQDQEFQTITLGQLRIMGNSTQVSTTGQLLPPWITQNLSQFGSGGPVVVQKLWVYRFVFLTASATDPISIPASRFLLSSTVIHESDLVYTQRLRRNYELKY